MKFTDDVREPVKARIRYAFRVFAAIYNYRVIDSTSSDARCLTYGPGLKSHNAPNGFFVPARYEHDVAAKPAGMFIKYRYAGEEVPLFFGIDAETGRPDWLGEIFAWISSNYELGITRRDAVGRIRYADMIFGRMGLSPSKPYATLLMAWMENALKYGSLKETLPRAESPLRGQDHLVVCSQDVDFHYVNKSSAVVRLLKNMAIAALQPRSSSFFLSNLRAMARLLCGQRVGDYLHPMMTEMQSRGLLSTLFILARHGHRRDANYQLKELVQRLSEATRRGFDVELHGSYASVVDQRSLRRECETLEQAIGMNVLGNRQHWLRFDRHEELFQAIADAGLLFDSSLGFSDAVGFRNGASFAFPPYDFKGERPYSFLEIPLVLMDVALQAASRRENEEPQRLADAVLEHSRRWGWGGISVLWHNPMEALHVTEEINQVFWNCAPTQPSTERWMNARQFLQCCLARYQNAGLLEGVRIPN